MAGSRRMLVRRRPMVTLPLTSVLAPPPAGPARALPRL
jgi:hypothetical protein